MTGRRRLIALIVAAAAQLTATAPADAAFVSRNPETGEINFVASPGEANRVSIAVSGADLLVTDGGVERLGILTGCTGVPEEPRSARCPAAGTGMITVDLSDLADEATTTAPVPVLFSGADGDDVLRGGDAADRLDGGPGSDTLDGGAGDDQLHGNERGQPGPGGVVDRLSGGPGTDRLEGAAGSDALDGGAGDDTLVGGGAADAVQGGDGADRLSGGDGDDALDGGLGDDRVGSSQATGVAGQSRERGSDVLEGGVGDDALFPGAGIAAGPDADRIRGGDGHDTVSYDGRLVGVTVSKDGLGNDGGLGERDDVGGDVERVQGTQRDDVLTGGDGQDQLVGGPGDDSIDGRAGDDALSGDGRRGAGSDVVAGGGGVDRVAGNRGEDTVDGGPGDDRLDGGRGTDTAAFPSGGVDIALAARAVSAAGGVDVVAGLENFAGGRGENTVTGTAGRNVIRGAAGEDYVDGRRGRDRLVARGGADMLAARDGARDRAISCGPGVDFAIVDPRDRPVERGPDRCERVDDGSRRRPRAGSELYVDPERCRKPLEAQLPAADRLVPLADAVILPTGSARARTELDATACAVELTAAGTRPGASGTADVSGDRFDVAVSRQAVPSVDLTVAPPACGARAGAAVRAAQAGLRVKRRRGRGRWRVIGGYSNAASYGTDWTTIEQCDRTITIVHEGRIELFDKTRGVTVQLSAGERYEALAPAATAAAGKTAGRTKEVRR